MYCRRKVPQCYRMASAGYATATSSSPTASRPHVCTHMLGSCPPPAIHSQRWDPEHWFGFPFSVNRSMRSTWANYWRPIPSNRTQTRNPTQQFSVARWPAATTEVARPAASGERPLCPTAPPAAGWAEPVVLPPQPAPRSGYHGPKTQANTQHTHP